MEDLESEERVVEREVDREGEPLVPDRPSRSGVVRLGGETAVRVKPEDGVRLEIAVSPVDVLEVLRGDDCDFEVERLRRWWPR